jgi:glutathione S-transferase
MNDTGVSHSTNTQMVLHGGPISPFVRKVGICIIEKGLEAQVRCKRAPTAMVKANLELLRYNPLSKIPTLVTTDGRALFDSDVICEYLDTTFPPGWLWPAAKGEHWSALRWNALGTGALDALVLWRFERNRPPPQQMAEVLRAFETKVQAALDLIETEISALAASPFGIGHIPIGCLFGYLDFRFPDLDWRNARPRSADWFADLMQRPAFLRTIPYDGACPVESHLWKQT